MKNEEVKRSVEEINLEAYSQWLQHPTTKQMFKVIDAHELAIIDCAVGASFEADNFCRDRMLEVKTVRAIKTMINKPELFFKQLNNITK